VPNWMTPRLTGIGEGINLLGLAAGTDGLGSGVQVAGLIAVMAALWSLGQSPRDRLFAALLALPPVVLPLGIAQKPQLFPATAVAVAMILLRTARSSLDFALVFGCLAGAMGSKYGFFVSGGLVGAAALIRAAKHRLALPALLCAAAAFLVLAAPVLL